MMKNKYSVGSYIKDGLKDLYWVCIDEFRNIFKDAGVILIFFVAGIGYPLLYNVIYYNEAVFELPVAIVDNSQSKESRDFLRKLDATPEIRIYEKCINMEEAKRLFIKRKVHGIVLIPADYHKKLNRGEQAIISTYSDMSSFLYYKTFTMGVSQTMLGQSREVKLDRYSTAGIVGEQTQQLVKAAPFNDNVFFFNPGSGFSSFLVPALLIMILHQTLFFGIGMLAGTAREENRHRSQIPEHLRGKGIYRVVLGKALCYFVLYLLLSAYMLIFIPDVFNLPHIGNLWTLLAFIVPFLLATIFFSMTASVFIKNRETGFVTFLFCTLILLFLSGITWPRSNMPEFWKYFSYLFPSTHGIQGYVKISTMAADLPQIRFEYVGLWIQTAVYFILASFSLIYTVKKEEKRALEE